MKKILSIVSIFILILLTSCKPQEDNPTITSVNINIDESVLEFIENEFDPSLIKLNIILSNNTKESKILTNDMIKSDVSSLHLGDNTLEAEYEGHTFYFKITIKPKDDLRFSYQSFGVGYFIDGYYGEDEIITLPKTYNGKPVLGIVDSAFLKNDVIKVVYIPKGYTTIEAAAFYQCPNLISIYVPSTVTTVGEYALNGINVIYIEGTSTSWPNKWYDEAKSTYYENVNEIHSNDEYQYLVIDNEVTITCYIGNKTNVEIPSALDNKTVTSIGSYAFAYNTNIEKVSMANTIKVIKDNAFNNCANLTSVTLSQNLQRIEASAFCYCSMLENLIFPETLEFIGNGAFNMCTTFTKLVIPKSVKEIEFYAFAWCTGMQELYIYNTLEHLGQGVIYSCSKLKVYTEFASAPSTWHENFNPSNRPINWNYTIE